VNPLIFRANRYILWGEIKNLAFEDKKGKISRNDFSTAKSCNGYSVGTKVLGSSLYITVRVTLLT
jgi:hypothetical protein